MAITRIFLPICKTDHGNGVITPDLIPMPLT